MSGTNPGSNETHCVELFLPLRKAGGEPIALDVYQALEDELTQRFGGVTAFSRAPARGRWTASGGRPTTDDIVIYEVMVRELDQQWWAQLRERLESELEQEEVLVRAHPIVRL